MLVMVGQKGLPPPNNWLTDMWRLMALLRFGDPDVQHVSATK